MDLSMKEQDQLIIFNKVKEGLLSKAAAARALQISVRWVRKKYARFLEQGASGLKHKSRGRKSHRAWDEEEKASIILQIKERYRNCGPKFVSEKLELEWDIIISKETLRKWMVSEGLWAGRKRKSKHRARRQRREYFGEMIQFDGSPEAWFEDRGPRCTLLNFVDDATSKVPYMVLAESESMESVMNAFHAYIVHYGIPGSLYVDFGSVYHVHKGSENEKITQFGRACKELGVTIIYARSPQAKGRVERSHATHQDRLIKELRLAGINSIEEANKFIQGVYLPLHNNKFSVPAAKSEDIHRPIGRHDLKKIFCIQEQRVLSNDFTIQYKNRILQVTHRQIVCIRPRDLITIYDGFDGSLALSLRGFPLNFTELINSGYKKSTSESRQIPLP